MSIFGTRFATGGAGRDWDTSPSLSRAPWGFGCGMAYGTRIVSRRVSMVLSLRGGLRLAQRDDYSTDGGSRGPGRGVDSLLALRPRLRRSLSRTTAIPVPVAPPGDRAEAPLRRAPRALREPDRKSV